VVAHRGKASPERHPPEKVLTAELTVFEMNAPIKNPRLFRQTWATILVLIWIMCPVMLRGGETPREIETAGFFEVHYQHQKEAGQQYKTHVGQAEYGICAHLPRAFSLEVSVAYVIRAPLLELGTGVIKWCKAMSSAFDITVGQFDVPFGINFRHIAAPDRRFLEPSLVSATTLNWFNSIGGSLSG